LWAGKRFPLPIISVHIAQVLGAIAGAFVLYLIATGKAGFDVVQSGFAANGYEAHSPGGYSLFAALVCEIVMTYMFYRHLGRHHGVRLWGLPVSPSVLR
jgi:aquaporin Z